MLIHLVFICLSISVFFNVFSSLYDIENPTDDVLMTRSGLEPRSSSPNQLERTRPGAVPSTGSPPREDRIAAIKQTAAQLKQRLESEAWRLGLNLQATALGKTNEQPETFTSTSDYTVFKGPLPGMCLCCC